MKYIENEKVELKEIFSKEIKKEIVAFANTYGGELYIGINDFGEVVGVNNPDEVILQTMNMLRDNIKPDIMSAISSSVINDSGKNIIKITVSRGTNAPYYLQEKGLKPSGVFVRQGSSSAPASEAAIRKMIKETDGDSFEKERSLETELSFDIAKKEFQTRNLQLNVSQMKTLGIIKDENIYTNLGLLLSDQCKHSIKVAIFHGNNKLKFKDRKEFSGSLLKQLNDVYTYVDLINKTNSEIKGLIREDKRDYPEDAIREALINAIVHREYSFSGSTLISVFENRIEIVSLGGLFGGITMEDISAGISQARNEKLSAIFYRLQLIEAYGTGIAKIMESYPNSIIKPEIKVTDNVFSITLPNTNVNFIDGINADYTSDSIIKYIDANGKITRKVVESILDVGQTMAGRLLKNLIEENIIMKKGKGLKTYYVKNNKK